LSSTQVRVHEGNYAGYYQHRMSLSIRYSITVEFQSRIGQQNAIGYCIVILMQGISEYFVFAVFSYKNR